MAGWKLIVERLSRHSLLSERERIALMGLPHQVRRLKPSESFLKGMKADDCLVILKGLAAKVILGGKAGKEFVTFLFPGDWGAVLPKADRCYNIRALGAVDIAAIPAWSVEKLVAQHHNVAMALWREMAAECALLQQTALNVGVREKSKAIAHLLCEMHLRAKSAGMCVDEASELAVNQSDLASALGMSIVTFNRNLQVVRKTGAVELKRGKLVMRDFEKLASFADFDDSYLFRTRVDTTTIQSEAS